ncbi:MAG: diacylglycerol kinase family protein [Bacteroidota bacterium]
MTISNKKNSLKKTFRDAFRGIYLTFLTERNSRIHLSIAILVTVSGFFFKIGLTKWMILLLLFAMVISAEMINTAIEKLADISEPNTNEKVREVKDIAAGAVLWTSIVSVIIGIIIFVPEILEFIYTNPNY